MTPLIVECDSREKLPIPFPATIRLGGVVVPVQEIITKLPYGDYRLSCNPTGCVIERKASQSELLKNLFDPADTGRAMKAFAALAKNARYPVLFLEMYLGEPLNRYGLDPAFDVDDLLSRFYTVVARYGFQLMWAGRNTDRRVIGRHLLHLMAQYALADKALQLQTR